MTASIISFLCADDTASVILVIKWNTFWNTLL